MSTIMSKLCGFLFVLCGLGNSHFWTYASYLFVKYIVNYPQFYCMFLDSVKYIVNYPQFYCMFLDSGEQTKVSTIMKCLLVIVPIELNNIVSYTNEENLKIENNV